MTMSSQHERAQSTSCEPSGLWRPARCCLAEAALHQFVQRAVYHSQTLCHSQQPGGTWRSAKALAVQHTQTAGDGEEAEDVAAEASSEVAINLSALPRTSCSTLGLRFPLQASHALPLWPSCCQKDWCTASLLA